MGGVRPKPFSRPTVHCKRRVKMKDILQAKSVILENCDAGDGGPLPPRVANRKYDERECVDICKCNYTLRFKFF